MPEPIASLTPRQAALLPGVVESWRKIALATERVDPASARRAVRALYRAAGLPEPRAVICLTSPIACLIARAILVRLLRHTRRRFPSFYFSFYDRDLHEHLCEDLDEPFSIQVWRATWKQLQEQIGEPQWRPLVAQLSDVIEVVHCLGDRIRRFVPDPLSGQLTPQLGQQLTTATLFTLWREVDTSVQGPIDAQIRSDFWRDIDRRKEGRPGAFLRREWWLNAWQYPRLIGGQEAPRLALHDFAEHAGVQYDAKSKRQLEAFKAYARSCGWLYSFDSIAFVSDRPSEIHFDAEHRLHHETDAAVRYCDGWSVYVWHGTNVPSWLIEERASITPTMIDELPDARVRQAALEIYSYGRYLSACKANLIAADELHGQPRRLLEVLVGGFPFRIVEVVNGSCERDGTRRKFHLAAMPGDTPADAIAASYGIAPAHYQEAVRT